MTYFNVTSLCVGSCRHPEKMTVKDGSIYPVDFPALPTLLIHPSEGPILFDTGYDQAFLEATNPFPERFYRLLTPVSFNPAKSLPIQLAEHGIHCEDVRHLILSHFHGDHMAGTHHFPNARIYCARAGFDLVCKANRINGTKQGVLKELIPKDFSDRAQFFEDKKPISLSSDFKPFEQGVDVLGDGSLLAIELPGHCPGHWGIAVRDTHHGWHFLIADAAWSLDAVVRNMPPPRLASSFLGNTKKTRATLTDLHQLHINNPELRITPYHCPHRAAELKVGKRS